MDRVGNNFKQDLRSIGQEFSKEFNIDVLNLDLSSGLFREQVHQDLNRIIRAADCRDQTPTIVDLSCGKGVITGLLSSYGYKAVGCDVKFPSGEQLGCMDEFWQTPFWKHMAKRTSSKANPFFYYEPGNIGLKDGCCDVVIAYAVYEHVPPEHRSAWLREAHRLLRAGGVLLIAHCPRPESPTERIARLAGLPAHEYLVPSDELIRHVCSIGFEIQDVWLNDHIPTFMPWGPRWLREAYIGLQDDLLLRLEKAVGFVTKSRWAHHTNLIAVRSD